MKLARENQTGHDSSRKFNCDQSTGKKLSFLPEEVRNVCACDLILRTEVAANNPNSYAIWHSYNDEALMLDAIRLRKLLSHKGESLHTILVFGGASPGLYDYKGNLICKPVEKTSDSLSALAAKLLNGNLFDEMNGGEWQCFGRWSGKVDTTRVSYSFFKARYSGPLYISMSDGEKYVLEDY